MINTLTLQIKGSISSQTNHTEVLSNLARETIKSKVININDYFNSFLFMHTNI